MRKNKKGQSEPIPQTILEQKPGSMLDKKTNEDFNNEHPDHDGPELKTTDQNKKFVCPGHPEIISGKPGKCSICGGLLIEEKQDGFV